MDNLLQIGIVLTAIDKMSGVLTGAAEKATQGFARLQQKIKAVSATMTEMGTKATLMGHGILTALETPVKAFADLDEASTDLRVAMMNNFGQVSSSFDGIMKRSIELGNQLKGDTADFVNTATALKENGVAEESILKGGLDAASYLGVVLKMVPAQAAEMTAKFREAFGLAENELTKMADLTQRAKFGFGLNPEEIKYAAQYAGSTLNNLKLTGIENTKMFLAMQGIARQKGMEGSVFGTNFASMLNNIGQMEQKLGRNSKIMKEVNGDLRRAGIHMQFFDKAGKFVGLEKMVGELEKLNVLSDQDKLNVMNKIFGMEGGRVASILAEAGVEGLKKALGVIDSQGDLFSRLKAIADSVKGVWESLTGTITNLWAAVGKPMVTALLPLLNKLNDLTGGPLMDWVNEHRELVKWLGLGTAALGVLLVALGGLGIVAGAVGSGLAAVVSIIGALGTAFVFIGKSAALVLGGLKLFGRGAMLLTKVLVWLGRISAIVAPLLGKALLTAFLAAAKGAWALAVALAANPITWIIAGIIALGVAIYLLVKHWDVVKVATQQFWSWFTACWNAGMSACSTAIDKFLAALHNIQNGIGQWWNNVKNGLKSFRASVENFFSDLVKKCFEFGAAMLDMLVAGIKSKISSVIGTVSGLTERIRGFFNHSPAKEGALKDIHQHTLSEMVASAIKPGPVVRALQAMTAAGLMALAPLTNPVVALATATPPARASHGTGLSQPALMLPALAKLSATPAMSAPAAMPALPPLSLPLPPAPKPAPRLAPSAAAQSGAAAPVTIHFAPQITVQGGSGTAKDDIMAALKKHEHELVKLIEQVMARNARRQY